MIDVTWEPTEPAIRIVEIRVEAWDRPKLVRDITTVLGDQHINILSASFSADPQNLSHSYYIFEIGSDVHLEEILNDLKKIESVIDVTEVSTEEEAR
jgi:GTP pyrophosphokinase